MSLLVQGAAATTSDIDTISAIHNIRVKLTVRT